MTTDTIHPLGGSTTALVVIDLQGGVLTEEFAPHPAAAVLDRCLRLVEALRRTGGLIVYVRSSHLPNARDRMRVLNDKAPLATTPPVRPQGWDDLDPSLPVSSNDVVITKRGFNAFYGSDLDLQLRRHGVTDVLLAGVTTNFGVEGTARNAADHGYHVMVVEDACSSVDGEMHQFAVTRVMPYFARIRTLDQVLAQLEGAPGQDDS